MWGNDNNQQAFKQVYEQPEHEAKMSHELLGGAAAFMAMREYEKHQAKNGNPPSHAFVKEMLAGIAGAEVDRLAETKGMDYMDREKAKRHAKQQAEQMYEQSGMYNRDLPEQHDDWQQGQGYQAYQQGMGGGGGGYNQGGFNQGMGGGGGYDQGMGGGGGFNQGGGGYGGQNQMGYGNQGGYDGNMNQNNQMGGGYGGQQEPHHHHHHQQEY